MDRISLVDLQTEGGRELIDALRRESFPVTAAYWLYTGEAGQWYLYLVSEEVDRKGIGEAYRSILRTMRQLPSIGLDRFEVKLVSPNDRTARAVTDYLRKRAVMTPTSVNHTLLHDVYLEGAYIYPTAAPAGLP